MARFVNINHRPIDRLTVKQHKTIHNSSSNVVCDVLPRARRNEIRLSYYQLILLCRQSLIVNRIVAEMGVGSKSISRPDPTRPTIVCCIILTNSNAAWGAMHNAHRPVATSLSVDHDPVLCRNGWTYCHSSSLVTKLRRSHRPRRW